MAKKISYSDIFDLSNPADLQKAIKAIQQLDTVYDQMVNSINQGSKQVQSAINGTVKSLDGLEKEMKGLSEVKKQDQKQIQELSNQIKTLSTAYDAQSKQLKKLQSQEKQISNERKNVSKASKDLNNINKEAIALEAKLGKVKAKDAKETAILRQQIQEANKANKQAAKEALGLVSVYDKESQRLISLRKQYKDLALTKGTNSKQAQNLKKEVTALDGKLKSLDSSVGQNQRNVGNYGDALSNLNPAIGGAINQFKVFSKILIASPIGLLVAALGALVGAFLSTQRGSDALNKVIKPLMFLFDSFIGVLQELSFEAFDWLKRALDDPIGGLKELGNVILENVINRFKAFNVFIQAISQAIEGDWSGALKTGADAVIQFNTGIENGTDKLTEFGEAAIEAGKDLEKLERQLEELEIALTVPLAKAQNEFRKLDGIAKDNLRTEQERIKAYNDAEKQLRFIVAAEQKQLQLELEIAELKATANDTDREAQLEIQQIKANIINAETAGQKRINTLIASRSALEKKLAQEQRREQLQRFEDINKVQVESVKIASNEIEDINSKMQEEITKKIQEENQKRAFENQKRIEDERRTAAAIEEVRNVSFAAADMIGNEIFDRQSIRREEELQAFKNQKQIELELAGDNAEARAAIEAQIQQKEKEAKIAQAKADKRQALFNIAISTAEAILRVTAQTGTLAPFVIPGIIALGAIQAGIVASRPLPQFEDGGFVGTNDPIITSEKGYEYAVTPGGKLIKTGDNGAEIRTDIPKGSFVIPHHISKALDEGIDQEQVNIQSNSDLQTIINLREGRMADAIINAFASENDILAQRIDKSVKSAPVPEWNISDRKLKKYMKEGNTRREDWRNKNIF